MNPKVMLVFGLNRVETPPAFTIPIAALLVNSHTTFINILAKVQSYMPQNDHHWLGLKEVLPPRECVKE